jgi:hypothetical protein
MAETPQPEPVPLYEEGVQTGSECVAALLYDLHRRTVGPIEQVHEYVVENGIQKPMYHALMEFPFVTEQHEPAVEGFTRTVSTLFQPIKTRRMICEALGISPDQLIRRAFQIAAAQANRIITEATSDDPDHIIDHINDVLSALLSTSDSTAPA